MANKKPQILEEKWRLGAAGEAVTLTLNSVVMALSECFVASTEL